MQTTYVTCHSSCRHTHDKPELIISDADRYLPLSLINDLYDPLSPVCSVLEGVLTSSVCKRHLTHLHSLDIPTAKQRCSRQYWQRFLVILLMMQFLSRWQVYAMFFCTLRRKKPCREDREDMNYLPAYENNPALT